MDTLGLVEIIAFPGWLVAVTYRGRSQFQCWIVNPEGIVLNDGEIYADSHQALASGCLFVQYSLDQHP